MELPDLNDHFGIPGVLHFEQAAQLTRARITTPAADATIYLQGAHITGWQPAGERPVLFLSPQAEFSPGKPIRGGVPISFPWFATDSKPDRDNGKPGPAHGFARTELWAVAFAALSGSDLHLTFTLGPTDLSRRLGFDRFRVAYQVTIGQTLDLQLTVANESDTPLKFEEALHTYFAVTDVSDTTVTGLEPTAFLDKTDNSQAKPPAAVPLTFSGPTDRVYADTSAPCTLHDRRGRRSITNTKTNSDTTVVFNPWRELPDLGPGQWQHMLCVETANTGPNAITLAPRSAHTLRATITVQGSRV